MRVALLRFSCATLAALLLFLTSNASYGVQSDWKASLGDWFISTNWTSAGVPNSTIDAVIANGGTALITAPGAEALDLFLGAPTGVGSTGTLLVTNNGSSLGSLTIDNLALIAQSPAAGVTVTGTLTISNGASLFQPAGAAMTVASGTNPSHGNITITGAGSSLNIAALALGFDIGQATLNVQSGGAALTTEASIAGSGNHGASSSGSTGSATVTGAGSAWYVSNHTYPFNIGYDGNGSLTISSGGTLGSYSAAIANQPGSVGSVTVTGAGSTWTNVENIYVSGNGTSSASGGNGALHITSGGLVNAHLLEVFSTGLANVDNGSTSTAGLVVAGDPVAYTLGGSYGDLTVGSNTAGRMEIQSGGAVASLRGYMGFGSGSDGSVLVTGSGAQRSSWQCQGSVWVGNGGNGTLEVRNGGRVTSAGNGYIAFSNNTSGYAIVSGANSGWITQQSLFIGGNAGAPGGSGTLQIEDQAFVQAFNVTLYNSGTLVLGTSPALLGNFTALGGFIQPIADTTFFQDITLGAGGVRVLTHGFNLTLAGTLSGSGVLEKSKGSFTEGPGTLTLSHANTYSGGTSLLAGKLLVTNASGSATGSGLVTASSGTVLGGTGTMGSPVTILSGATLLGGNGVAASLALKLSNNLTINSGGNVLLALGPSGAHSSVTRTGGTWAFPASLAFSIFNAGAQPGFYDNVISGLASDPGNVGSWTISTAGFSGTFSYDGSGNIDLNLTSVPTPPTPPLAGCGWTSGAPYPIPVLRNGMATVANVLYSFGGTSTAIGNRTAAAYKFDGAIWSAIAPLPEVVDKPAVVSDGTYVYIIGGYSANGDVRATVYRYNMATDSYSTLAPATVAATNTAAVFLNGKIYKIGGFGALGGINSVEVYTIATNSWAAAANYPMSLGYISAFAQDGFIYGVGGTNSAGNGSAKTYRYDPSANTWNDGAITDLPLTRWAAACVRYNGAAVVAGGYVNGSSGTDISSSVLVWDAPTNSWGTLPDLPQPRADTSGTVLNGTLSIVGGTFPGDNMFNGSTNLQQLACAPGSFTVTTLDDHNDGTCTLVDCTLREAITAANSRASEDLISIFFAPTLTGPIQLTSVLPDPRGNIAVQGPGAKTLTVRRNTGSYRVWNINSGVSLTLRGLTTANGSSNSGGGAFNAGTLTLSDVAIAGNVATNGGGIFNNFGNLTINNSTISGNSVSSALVAGSGGGIFNSGGVVTINNSTISGNSAIGPGGNSDSAGGIITNVGTVTLTNTTITNNSGDIGGGVRVINGGVMNARNTIFALNTSPSGPDLNGPLTSQGYNMIGTSSGGTITPPQATDHIGVSAAQLNLGSLQDNGGNTLTHALLSGSVAVNQGDSGSSATDQRGFARITPSDIGAFEFNGTAPAVQLLSVVSRKTHGAAGDFDVNLPIVGTPGVECRSGGAGGNHTLIFTFTNPIATVGSVMVSSGTGSVSTNGLGADPHQYLVTLSGVTNAQKIVITLTNVTDTIGDHSASVAVTMGILVADINGDSSVNSADATIARNNSGKTADATNFRTDLNLDGAINSADATIARNNSGQGLPTADAPVPTVRRGQRVVIAPSASPE